MSKPWIRSYDKGVPATIDADAYPSVVALLEQAAKTYGDLPAFECFGTQMTYAQFDEKSRKRESRETERAAGRVQ